MSANIFVYSEIIIPKYLTNLICYVRKFSNITFIDHEQKAMFVYSPF